MADIEENLITFMELTCKLDQCLFLKLGVERLTLFTTFHVASNECGRGEAVSGIERFPTSGH